MGTAMLSVVQPEQVSVQTFSVLLEMSVFSCPQY